MTEDKQARAARANAEALGVIDAAARRHAAQERRDDIGDALGHQFLVRVVAVAREVVGDTGA